MDRLKRTANLIKDYYEYKRNRDNAKFVQKVCRYFDEVLPEEIAGTDLNFLSLIANEAGVPQYYDMLLSKKNIKEGTMVNDISLAMFSSFMYDASLTVGDQIGSKLHRFQRNIIKCFSLQHENRYILTAPTSFGKTYLVFQILKKMDYKNVLLVFPTISLLTENFERIKNTNDFKKYKIHTLSESEFVSNAYNIFIFTPERYLSFLDSNKKLNLDFTFIDEIYKIDNEYVIDHGVIENERDTAYRLALEYVCQASNDILLAGPYIPMEKKDLHNSFLSFCEENRFSIMSYNKYEIVSKSYYKIDGKGQYNIDGNIIKISNKQKNTIITKVVTGISTPEENTIVYCGRKIDTEKYAQYFLGDNDIVKLLVRRFGKPDEVYNYFLQHLERTYGSEWIVVAALKARIGIHHGLIPKYIQKEIINLFNRGQLICLFSTTTITEGVNTPAKNIVIMSMKKGRKELKKFDVQNIAGRAGRFGKHYLGRIIDLSNGFEKIMSGENEKLVHKNYDVDIPKTDVDIQITKDKFLNSDEIILKKQIEKKAIELGLPKNILNRFKVVGLQNKLRLYEAIKNMTTEERNEINKLIRTVVFSRGNTFHWKGIQVVIDILKPIVTDSKLFSILSKECATKDGQYFSLLIYLLDQYLKHGFMGMVNYNIKNKHLSVNAAMRKVADTVYNIFKYQLVKYLGTFDILYRYLISVEKNCNIDNVAGLTYLLQKLEYNATDNYARIVSDYGAPFKVVKKYESPNSNIQLDKYEEYIDKQISGLLSNN